MNNGKKIKVAIVINDFSVGGVQRLYIDILSRLDRSRFEVSLITLFDFGGRETLYDLLPEDVEVYRHGFSGAYDIQEWFTLAKNLSTLQPDVVISNLFLSNFVSRVLKSFFGYTSIVVEHNTYIHKTRSQIFWDRVLSYLTFSIIAVSNSVKEFTSKQERIPLSKFTVIPNGIDIKAIEEKLHSYNTNEIKQELGTDRKYIVSVARLIYQKNHQLLVDGFAEFSKKNNTHDLLIVGGGSLLEQLKEQARSLDVLDRIHFLGNQMDVYKYYAVSDFFISTSIIEGFGIAHAEALACGLPLLSTKTAGPDEMIEEGKTGFFIYESTSKAVADGMTKMISNLEEMKENTKEKVKRYDISKTVETYEQLIEQAVER